MRKSLILSTCLLLCAVWVAAQTGSSSSSTQPSQTSPSSQSPTSSQSSSSDTSGQTMQGCLSGSAGNFTLTSSSGTTYQLAGDTSKLTDHVGEEVEITGTPSSSGAGTSPSSSASNPSSSSGSSMGGGQTINVTNVKKVASSCSTGK